MDARPKGRDNSQKIRNGEYELIDNVRSSVLNEAAELVNGSRQSDYGPPEKNFACVAKMWSAYLGDRELTAGDACRLLALLKIARLSNGPHFDSSLDACGYMALGEEMDQTT
jgi:hypothetical protein